MNDPGTIRIYDARAQDYAKKFEADGAADPQLKAFIAACPTGGCVLDLGCGPGIAAAQMAQAGLQVDATDASAEMVMLANQRTGVHARQASFEQINGTDLYHGIWASFSLLHAPRTSMPAHLSALHRALKPSGAFYIGLKLGKGESRDDIGRHYTYYEEDELNEMLKTAGFTVLNHTFGKGEGLDGGISRWISVAAHG